MRIDDTAAIYRFESIIDHLIEQLTTIECSVNIMNANNFVQVMVDSDICDWYLRFSKEDYRMCYLTCIIGDSTLYVEPMCFRSSGYIKRNNYRKLLVALENIHEDTLPDSMYKDEKIVATATEPDDENFVEFVTKYQKRTFMVRYSKNYFENTIGRSIKSGLCLDLKFDAGIIHANKTFWPGIE